MSMRHNGNDDQYDGCNGSKDVVRRPIGLVACLGSRQLTFTGSLGITHNNFSAAHRCCLGVGNGHGVEGSSRCPRLVNM